MRDIERFFNPAEQQDLSKANHILDEHYKEAYKEDQMIKQDSEHIKESIELSLFFGKGRVR